MEKSERHLIKYDLHILRDYAPYYFLGGGRYDPEPYPPITVTLGADFDTNEAATAFEAKVRELLETL